MNEASLSLVFIFSILALTLGLFLWGRLRHDLVAIISLLLLVFTGLIPAREAFTGFAHPAVITVVMILIVSHALQNSGLIEWIGSRLMEMGQNYLLQLSVLCLTVALASAFMNNVGALAVLMPVALHVAAKNGHSPSRLLMPIAFASLLGGMITLVGTPPNIIISGYRREELGEAFSMFDFAPVGLLITAIGLVFILSLGWRLLPKRIAPKEKNHSFKLEDYLTEVSLSAESKLVGLRLAEVPLKIEGDYEILNIIREENFILTPSDQLVLRPGDILSLEAEAKDLAHFVRESGVRLEGEGLPEETKAASNIKTVEAVVMANSLLLYRTAAGLSLRKRYGVNLLAVSRQDTLLKKRLDRIRFKMGDVLLLQGESDKLSDVLQAIGCVPLADRGFKLKSGRKIALAMGIFSLAILSLVTAWLPVEIAFTAAALLMVLTGVISSRELYQGIDWPVVVMLGAMMPLGTALERTGGAKLIADALLIVGANQAAWFSLVLLFVLSMLISNVINNAATAVLFAPLALSLAKAMALKPDPFLMVVALGASAAFLTPIGHQSNTLVMGPGGYRFSDYLRMGAPLSLLMAAIVVPIVLFFWPLR